MKKLSFLFVIVGLFVLSSCEKNDRFEEEQEVMLKSGTKMLNFRTHLSGMNETVPVETMATGQAIFQLNKEGTELSYKLIVDDIENVTMSHIHHAPEGANGPVVAWLYPAGPPPMLISGVFGGVLAQGVITDANLVGPLVGMSLMDLVNEIYMGNAYVNVHTLQNPGGEIRGQISGNMPMGNK
jgi:hypothetical protein